MTAVNRLGVTEEVWNEWIAEVAEWMKSNKAIHKPHEVCDCDGLPILPFRKEQGFRGHCAAVGPPVSWKATVET